MKEEYVTFLEKVPALRSRGKAILTLLYMICLIGTMIFFFYFFDRIAWYMPILTQSFIAIIISLIGYIHIKKADDYRKKFGELAYQKLFYRFMLPYLVTWYSLFFHPLFISGPIIFSTWLISIIIGIILFIFFILVDLHIEKAGFKNITHGMDIYTVFPEETTIVRGEIYGYVRHPLYLALSLGCFALAFIANNYVAIIAASIQLVPCIIMGKIEDKELIKRGGRSHSDYIDSTAILFPMKRIFGFLKLLVLFK